MKRFNYENYKDCYFRLGRYDRGGLSIRIYNDTEGHIATCTKFIMPNLKDNYVFIKNYSENEGMLEFLKSLGVIKSIVGIVGEKYVMLPLVELDLDVLYSYSDIAVKGGKNGKID